MLYIIALKPLENSNSSLESLLLYQQFVSLPRYNAKDVLLNVPEVKHRTMMTQVGHGGLYTAEWWAYVCPR